MKIWGEQKGKKHCWNRVMNQFISDPIKTVNARHNCSIKCIKLADWMWITIYGADRLWDWKQNEMRRNRNAGTIPFRHCWVSQALQLLCFFIAVKTTIKQFRNQILLNWSLKVVQAFLNLEEKQRNSEKMDTKRCCFSVQKFKKTD